MNSLRPKTCRECEIYIHYRRAISGLRNTLGLSREETMVTPGEKNFLWGNIGPHDAECSGCEIACAD